MTNEYIRLDDLLVKLKESFSTLPDRHTSDREILLKIGQQEVITFIEQLKEET